MQKLRYKMKVAWTRAVAVGVLSRGIVVPEIFTGLGD